MQKLSSIQPERVFKYFEDISSIPRGSGNMDKISDFCMNFAKNHGLDAARDKTNNVIIYKPGTKGYETSEPVILQAHLDMVCQKTEDSCIDFLHDGLDLFVDGDFVKARGTTLGADNGIAVSMIMAILESTQIQHPPIEAVFTTDEEIGMIGAMALSFDKLKGRKMINLDSESPDVLTVSCAGGSDFQMTIPLKRQRVTGKMLTLTIKGLRGGHSGVEINSGRVNANILMARILNYAKSVSDFGIVSVDGGDKGNAIPLSATARLVADDVDRLIFKVTEYIDVIKREISAREPMFEAKLEMSEEGNFDVIDKGLTDKLIYALLCAPNGVVEMSAEIESLVESSLNLGILKTAESEITMLFTLRSNKQSALRFLEDKMKTFATCIECDVQTGGHYPPWEFVKDSVLQRIYQEKFVEMFGYAPSVEAIHAGLECGVFSDNLKSLDCVSIGPKMFDIHTTNERLSIKSTEETFRLVLNVLKECK